jgi:hypothetical protein
MAKSIFTYYLFISIGLCVFFTYSKRYQMPFDYELIFSVSEVIYYSAYLCVGYFIFLLSYRFFLIRKILDKNVSVKKEFNPRARLGVFTVVQSIIVLYFLTRLMSGVEYTNGEQYIQDYRPLGDKVSNLVLLVQSFLIFTVWRKPVFIFILLVLSAFIAFLFAWIDSSRASILPLVGLLYFFYKERKLLPGVFVLIYLIFCYMIAMVGRSFTDRIDFHSLNEIVSLTLYKFDEVLVWVVSYFTAFSVYQFAYITRDTLGDFTWYDFFYSITPLPSFAWPYIPDYENWRADEFRPMGAVSEVYRVSPLILFAYFGFKGFLAKAIDSMANDIARLFAVVIFIMTVVMMFQYNLRSTQWFYYLIAILYFLDRSGFIERSKRFSL